jgi:hypothetical protein
VFLLTNRGCTVFQQDTDIIRPAKSLPAAIWFFTVTDSRGAIVSSEIVFAAAR